jgi:hypothetical protein
VAVALLLWPLLRGRRRALPAALDIDADGIRLPPGGG